MRMRVRKWAGDRGEIRLARETRLSHVSSYVRQGAGRPLTGSTGATVSIFLGRHSEARELRAELGGRSFIPRIDRPHTT